MICQPFGPRRGKAMPSPPLSMWRSLKSAAMLYLNVAHARWPDGYTWL
jgi:hypothetical protein